ncbi:phage holin family protein [bacterium]|nr:phage holin family protein [bacterium]
MAEKATTGLIVGLLAYIVGQINFVTVSLFLFILIDFLTGVLGSKCRGEKYDKDKKTMGMIKKAGILILWFISVLIQLTIVSEGHKIGLDINTPFITLSMTFYLLGSETISILGNLSDMGVKTPVWFRNIVKAMKKEDLG